ncbi:Single-stranded DNA-binding protein [Chitinispirillum alkaliphilum]|nr:Single-stranded DNA-binding protein [Chitinispirillum alkaliphilum]
MGVNKAILIGNLGKDPELKYTPSGTAVATFSLATTERWSDKNGQRQDRTEWHNIVVWGRLAELVNQYLKKGRTCYIEGRISTRSWDDKDGNKKYRTEIVANSVEFLNTSAGNSAGQSSPDMSYSEPVPQSNNHASEPMSEEDLPF